MPRSSMVIAVCVAVCVAACVTDTSTQGEHVVAVGHEHGTLCDPRWINLPLQLDTDPSTPSPYGNNVDTAYLESIFTVNPNIKLVLKGGFPLVRFASAQTGDVVYGGASKVTGFIADHEFVMDPGSINPYVQSNPVGGLARDYTLEILPAGATSSAPNKIVLPGTASEKQMILIRYYSPHANVTLTETDIPDVYAQNSADGTPAACPVFTATPTWTRFPFWSQGITAQPGPAITFAPVACGGGCNAALPYYLAASPELLAGQVAVIRFKPPTFVNTRSGSGSFPNQDDFDTRYWSMTMLDSTTSMAVNGLVDYMATSVGGYVTLVVSKNGLVKAKSVKNGHNFVEDLRNPLSRSAAFIYRSLIPSQSFWPAGSDFPEAYWPVGKICNVVEYLTNSAACAP